MIVQTACDSQPTILENVTSTSFKKLRAAHQIFKLDIQVFFDSQPCVRNGFIQICVQVGQHLQGKHPVAKPKFKKHDYNS